MADVLKKILQYSPSKILVGLSNLLIIPILTYFLTPEEFGIYSLFFSINALVIMVASGWITQSTLRFYFEFKTKKEAFLRTAITTALLSNLFISTLYLGVYVTMEYNEKYSNNLLIISLLYILLRSLYAILQTVVRNENKIILYTILDICLSIFSVGLIYFLLRFTGIKESTYFYAYSFTLFLIITYLLIKFRFKVKLHGEILKRFLVYGLPLITLGALNWVLSMSDRVLLEYFTNPQGVGIYSANYSIIERVMLFVTSMMTVATGPIIMKTWTEKGIIQTRALLEQVTSVYLAITLPIILMFSFFEVEIMTSLIGEDYLTPGFSVIISIAVFFQGLILFSMQPLLLQNKSKLYAQLTLIAALINIVSNFILIPLYSIWGAALSTLISFVCLFGFSILINRKKKIWTLSYAALTKITVSLLVFYLISNFIVNIVKTNFNFIIAFSLAGLVYVICLWFFFREEILSLKGEKNE